MRTAFTVLTNLEHNGRKYRLGDEFPGKGESVTDQQINQLLGKHAIVAPMGSVDLSNPKTQIELKTELEAESRTGRTCHQSPAIEHASAGDRRQL